MKNSGIWWDVSWNPMTGCTHVSEACDHCYAERMARRFNLRDLRDGERVSIDNYFVPRFHPDRLDAPLHWRKPRRIFVCSMSDLFHEAFTDLSVGRVLDVIRECPQHTFVILTKRPERMRHVMHDIELNHHRDHHLPNLWLGVTVENQARADERIPILLDTPAAVRFVCCEPLLGAVDLVRGHQWAKGCLTDHYKAPIDWVIVGGENGPGARPMKPEWALGLYQQCKAAGVPFWWKGPGSKGVGPYSKDDTDNAIDMMCCHKLPSVQS